MSDAPAAPAPKKKKGGMMKIIMMLVGALVLIGGGVGAGLYAAGAGLVGGGEHKEEHEDPNAPKLVPKEGAEEGHGGEKSSLPIGVESEKSPDPTKYKATYYTFENPFTSNLRDSDGFAQIGIGVSTYYDAKVIENLKNDEIPIRSAVLMTIADQDAFAISTPEGKLKLQKELKDAINKVLREQEGFGGVDNVYFTSLVVQ